MKTILKRIKERIFPHYPCGDFSDDFSEFYEYEKDEEYLRIIQQDYIDANLIQIPDRINNIQFPWHGFTSKDFNRLNKRMTFSIRLFGLSGGEKTAKKYLRWFPDVYKAYFMRPILVTIENGEYEIHNDGRHRLNAAKTSNGKIPIWIVKHCSISEVEYDEYKKTDVYGNWRF